MDSAFVGSSITRRRRGFAAMSLEKKREITRKGGAAVSINRKHMTEIGRRGGQASSRSRRSNGCVAV